MKIRALILLGFMGLASIANAEVAAISAPDRGRILGLEGSVQVKEPGESSWKTPAKGSWLKAGSQIKTGPASRCDVGLGEGRSSVLQMKENSQTRLNTLQSSQILINLEEGSIFARVHGLKKNSTFKVSSPTAIASARGTGWEQSMQEVNVFESSVEVAGSGGETMVVEEGFGVDIDPQGDVKDPEPVSSEDKAEYENFESQAEQLAAEEASAPEESATEEKGSESAGDGAGTSEGSAFEGFGEDLGNEGLENPGESSGGESSEDALGEAKEEQQENEPEENPEEEGCVPSTANGYHC